MGRRLRCVLLCEDLSQERLMRRVVERALGSGRSRVDVKRQGSASFVLRELPREMRYLRQRPQEAVGLIVVVDGNAMGFRRRQAELKEVGGFSGAAWEQRVALCVPTRNVETWILWLTGERDLDETRDFKHRISNQSDGGVEATRKAAEEWFGDDSERRSAESSLLPALAYAREEIGRLARLARS